MMVDGDSRGRAVSGRPVFCGQRVAGALAWRGAFASRPEGFEGLIDDVMDAGAASSAQLRYRLECCVADRDECVVGAAQDTTRDGQAGGLVTESFTESE